MPRFFPEVSLYDLLTDPLTSIIMARDGVTHDELTNLMRSVARRRGTTERCEPVEPCALG